MRSGPHQSACRRLNFLLWGETRGPGSSERCVESQPPASNRMFGTCPERIDLAPRIPALRAHRRSFGGHGGGCGKSHRRGRESTPPDRGMSRVRSPWTEYQASSVAVRVVARPVHARVASGEPSSRSAARPRRVWLRGADSNRRPSGYGPDELPTALPRFRYPTTDLRHDREANGLLRRVALPVPHADGQVGIRRGHERRLQRHDEDASLRHERPEA